jgi:hypothetical protein
MRRITGMLATLLLAGLQSTAQEINYKNLLVPTSPGLVILDKAPASIEKPTSPKTLGVSVLRLVKQNEGALDFTPYWFFNHANYTFINHIDNKFPVLQTLNLSVAASQGDTSSYFSAGLRTHLFRQHSTGKRKKIIEIKDSLVAALSVPPTNLDLEKIALLKNDLVELTAEPQVIVELAGAMAGYSPDDKFSSLANNRYGVWLNIAYKPADKLPLSALGVFRYTKAISRLKIGVDSSFIDYGIAASYQQPKFDLQLEYVNRTDTENDDNYNRLVLVGNYLVAENLVIVASFGKNFSDVKNIVALFGVKFGISNERLK